jgi:uncharacterized membrane protein YczE
VHPQLAPRVAGGLALRSVSLVVGLFLFALGIVMLLGSGLGLSPWDVLNQGIEKQTPLSFGNANIVVALLVVALAAGLGSPIGPGTIANAFGVGLFVDLQIALGISDAIAEAALGLRWLAMVSGIAVVAIGSALYIGAAMGAGPRDSLMLVSAGRSGLRISIVRAAIESSVTVLGFALGGRVGIGTLAFALGIGPAVEVCFELLRRSPLAAEAPPRAEPPPHEEWSAL